jgi:hypothetical protein
MEIHVLSRIVDKKINAINVLVEIRLSDYLAIAGYIVDKNEMQRKKVRSSKTVYSLLRNDLRQGCTIPPICLAVRKDAFGKKEISLKQLESISDKAIEKFIEERRLIILDGLQRTYQLIELETELKKEGDKELLKNFNDRLIRAEIFLGINKIGILYRMLTLNTGQTPMSVRHQIEILYQDYLGKKKIPGVDIVREVDGTKGIKVGKYRFNEIVDGFQSYLEKDELAMDRSTLLEDVKSLEKLSKVGQKKDLFYSYVNSYHSFIKQIVSLSKGWKLNGNEELKDINLPFGFDSESLFIKSQVMTGFGAAIGSLEDSDQVKDLEIIAKYSQKVKLGSTPEETFTELVKVMERIRTTSKKIGNSQRRYFYYFFKSLFNPEVDSYLNVNKTISRAFQTYKVEFF